MSKRETQSGNRGALTKKELGRIKKQLLKRQEELAGILCKPVENCGNDGDADMQATQENIVRTDQSLKDMYEIELNRIALALKKIEDGTFGFCETCGDPISKERLFAHPICRDCFDCKDGKEGEIRSRGQRVTALSM